MGFDDDEQSVSGSRPIDLYTITTPSVTYRLTSYITDVTYGGFTFSAATMSRGNQQVAQDLTGRELVVYLPITHPLVQRFAAVGVPEHAVMVTLQRLQSSSGVAVQGWQGYVTGMSIDGHVATFRVPSVTDDAMKIQLPVVRTQKICNHVLYDSLCTIDRTDPRFFITTSIVSQNIGVAIGTLTILDMDGNPDHWATYGEILHIASGQRVGILEQVGNVLTLVVPIFNAVAGNEVQIFAGCSHLVSVCKSKFNNVINFGGMPDLNDVINPWASKGLGIIQQA